MTTHWVISTAREKRSISASETFPALRSVQLLRNPVSSIFLENWATQAPHNVISRPPYLQNNKKKSFIRMRVNKKKEKEKKERRRVFTWNSTLLLHLRRIYKQIRVVAEFSERKQEKRLQKCARARAQALGQTLLHPRKFREFKTNPPGIDFGSGYFGNFFPGNGRKLSFEEHPLPHTWLPPCTFFLSLLWFPLCRAWKCKRKGLFSRRTPVVARCCVWRLSAPFLPGAAYGNALTAVACKRLPSYARAGCAYISSFPGITRMHAHFQDEKEDNKV